MLFKVEKFIHPEIKFIFMKNNEKRKHQIIIPTNKIPFTTFSKSLKIIKNERSLPS